MLPTYRFKRTYKSGYMLTIDSLSKINDIIRNLIKKYKYKKDIVYNIKIGDFHEYETTNYEDIREEIIRSNKSVNYISIKYIEYSKKYLKIELYFSSEDAQLNIGSNNSELVDVLSLKIQDYIEDNILILKNGPVYGVIFIPIISSIIARMFGIYDCPLSFGFKIGMLFIIMAIIAVPIIAVLDYIYPDHVFYFGYSKKKYDRLLTFRKRFFWAIIIAIIPSFIAGVLLRFF